MSILALYGLWAMLLTAFLVRAKGLRNPSRALVIGGTLVVLAVQAVAMVRIALPSADIDFDTWSQMVRWRFDRVEEMFKPHRPMQNYYMYAVVSALRPLEPDYTVLRQIFSVVPMVAAQIFLVGVRRTLFGTPSLVAPWLAGCTLLCSTGGTFLIESWNDHWPLVPCYYLGVWCLLRLPFRPVAMAVAAVGVFLFQSTLHTAEVWLWAGAMVAVLFSRAGLRREVLVPSAIAWILMLVVSYLLVKVLAGGAGSAARYLAMYKQDDWGARMVDDFGTGFSRGAVGPVSGPAALAALAGLFGMLAARWLKVRRHTEVTLAALLGTAALFPAVYETTNPERFYTLLLLWPLIAVRGVVHLQALVRARRRLKDRALFAPSLGASLLVAAALVAGGVAALPPAWRTRNDTNAYVRYGEEIRQRLDGNGRMLVAHYYAFFLWHQFYFPGAVDFVAPEGESFARGLARPERPLYMNEPVADTLRQADRQRLRLVYQGGDDPATRVFQWDDATPPVADKPLRPRAF